MGAYLSYYSVERKRRLDQLKALESRELDRQEPGVGTDRYPGSHVIFQDVRSVRLHLQVSTTPPYGTAIDIEHIVACRWGGPCETDATRNLGICNGVSPVALTRSSQAGCLELELILSQSVFNSTFLVTVIITIHYHSDDLFVKISPSKLPQPLLNFSPQQRYSLPA